MKSEYQYKITLSIDIVASNERDAIIDLYNKLESMAISDMIKDHCTLERSIELGSGFFGESDINDIY